jgi:hypothetical protein
MLETDDEFVGMLRDALVAAGTPLSLCVSAYEVANARAQPIQVGICRHTGECRSVKLARRGVCKCGGGLLCPLDAAAARDYLMQPKHLARQAPLTRPC